MTVKSEKMLMRRARQRQGATENEKERSRALKNIRRAGKVKEREMQTSIWNESSQFPTYQIFTKKQMATSF
jgi:hypothetical protein